MPRYRFTIRDHDSFDDEDGVILPDDLAARTHAIGIIQELRKAKEADWSDYMMGVIRDGRVGPVDIHRSQMMAPTRNSMAANESAVFS
jgi:hypothetical protein